MGNNLFSEEAIHDLLTFKDMLRWAMSQFNENNLYYGHGTDNPWNEALNLISATLYLPPDLPIEVYDAKLTFSERRMIVENIIKRVEQRIPVPYITNRAWFCDLDFYVNEYVLIPRSPIGELIQQKFSPYVTESPKHILDLCTGSGCIAIACAHYFPVAEIDAVDISTEALAVAEENIQRHNMQERVYPICSDLFTRLAKIQYDLIIANPPYVDEEDMLTLPTEYSYEPIIGLQAGQDGLDLVRQILLQAANYLSDQGVLICEVGNSAAHLIEQYPQVPFEWVQFQHGGEGVFIFTKDQLTQHQETFASKTTKLV